MRDHTIVAGYGTMGRQAVETLLANDTTSTDHVVVIDYPGGGDDERQGSRADRDHGRRHADRGVATGADRDRHGR